MDRSAHTARFQADPAADGVPTGAGGAPVAEAADLELPRTLGGVPTAHRTTAGARPDRTDAELIKTAQRDPEPFGELYSRYVHSIHRWFAAHAPAQDASELTAETFAQAALSLRRFRDEAGGSAAPWLFGIARNILRRYHERNRVETGARQRLGIPIHSYLEPLDEIEDRLDAVDVRAEMRVAFGELPAPEQEALTLRVIDELSYDEVARQLGCSNTAARLRVMRARRRLSGLLRSRDAR